MFKSDLEEVIKKWPAADVIPSPVWHGAFRVERPTSMEFGDFATNAALVAAPYLKKNPKDLAVDLKSYLENSRISGIRKVEVAGPGFVNIHLTYHALMAMDISIRQLFKGTSVLIEYTSPNLFKPLHIGNLVGNILGEADARLLERAGATVVRINYPSDIGLTVAKGVWGLRKLNLDPADIKQLGEAYVAGNAAYEDGSAKEEIEAINKALYEDSDPSLSALRMRGIETSRWHLDLLCEKLGTKFDREFFESESGPVGRELVRSNLGRVFEESEGAVVYRGEQDGLHTRVFLNSQGLPTYEAKDLGLLKLKLDAYPDFEWSITDTGPEQKEYFKVLYAAAKKVLPQLIGKELMHTVHGYLKLTTGKMSSRLGNVITGESLIDELMNESISKMLKRDVKNKEKIAQQVAIGALKYAVLKQGAGSDIVFDPEKSLSLEGDSGPYLQYALVRTRGLLKTAKELRAVPSMSANDDRDFQEVGYMYRLWQILAHFSDTVERSAKERQPHYLANYLMELSSMLNHWYGTERIMVEGKILPDRISLIERTQFVLEQGLETLGIPVPEEM